MDVAFRYILSFIVVIAFGFLMYSAGKKKGKYTMMKALQRLYASNGIDIIAALLDPVEEAQKQEKTNEQTAKDPRV